MKIFLLLFLLYSVVFSQMRQLQRITDGDTFRFNSINCRIKGIDTPESAINNRLKSKLKKCKNITQKEMINAGKSATRFAKKVFATTAYYDVLVHGKGKYGREICSVSTSLNRDYSLKAVREGYAVPFYYFLNSDEKVNFKVALYEAKLGKKGLWKEYPNVMQCLLK